MPVTEGEWYAMGDANGKWVVDSPPHTGNGFVASGISNPADAALFAASKVMLAALERVADAKARSGYAVGTGETVHLNEADCVALHEAIGLAKAVPS